LKNIYNRSFAILTITTIIIYFIIQVFFSAYSLLGDINQTMSGSLTPRTQLVAAGGGGGIAGVGGAGGAGGTGRG